MSDEVRPVKVLGAYELECDDCTHRKGSVCQHPKFNVRKVKPLILADEGERHPAFCPLKEK